MNAVIVRGTSAAVAALEARKRAAAGVSLPAAEAAAEVVAEAVRRNAPIRTGALRRSIILDEREADSDGAQVQVTSELHYARFQEKGTRFHDAQPFFERAARVVAGPVAAAMARVYTAIGR